MRKQGLISLIRGELVRSGVRPSDGLVVAVSGGPDSMASLDLLRQLGWRLVVGHINHGLRKEADLDEKVVAGYCKKYALELVVKKVNLGSRSSGIEERARIARYAALAEIAAQERAQWIVTAHTADDQVETVVANWLRGSAVKGLGGMRQVTGQIVRPLLNINKRQLLEYAHKSKLKYAVDKSNAEVKFTRNRIRHQLLPALRKYNSQFDAQIWHNSQIWQQVDLALVELAKQHLKKVGVRARGGLVLSVSKLQELTPLMQIEVIKLAVDGELTGIERSHFAEVMKIIASPKATVAKRRLGGKLFASKAYDKITISRG